MNVPTYFGISAEVWYVWILLAYVAFPMLAESWKRD